MPSEGQSESSLPRITETPYFVRGNNPACGYRPKGLMIAIGHNRAVVFLSLILRGHGASSC